jgi:hypothetical protein
MAGFSAHGATFTFVGSLGNSGPVSFTGAITSINVTTPTAEIVDMTSVTDAVDVRVLVPTGAWAGGEVSVDYIATAGTGDVKDLVRRVGPLSFASPLFSVTRRAILESATQEASVNGIVRGSLTFRVTDYQGT